MLILASTSPRRIELLKSVGFQFQTVSPDCEELVVRGETPRAMVTRLAREKAASVETRIDPSLHDAIIDRPDTTVVGPAGKTVHKNPRDEKHATRILGKLQGKTHTVLTGYCLLALRNGTRIDLHSRVVVSKVSMRSLSRAMIQQYIATGEPMDKAGAYAAQGIGMALIEKVSGSYSNVVGLPMAQLTMDLEKRYGIRFWSQGNR